MKVFISADIEGIAGVMRPEQCNPVHADYAAARELMEQEVNAAIDGAFVLSTRGGDFDLQLGTDVCIGYLSHDADTVQLYLQETLTFLCYTAEASVALSA